MKKVKKETPILEPETSVSETGLRKQPIAILFAYNGFKYSGLERIKNIPAESQNGLDGIMEAPVKSVEGALFQAFPKEVLSLTHISRASLTAFGEHASKQVISLSFTGPSLPTVEQVNRHLPADIRIFKIHKVSTDFSARRTCEARTIEFLIPTYAFAAPPEATEYCNKAEDDDELTLPPEMELPKGGMFETIAKRRKHQSLERRQTFIKGALGNSDDKFSYPPDIMGISPSHIHRQNVIVSAQKKKKGWALFVENFIAMFKPKKKGSELLKQSLSVTMTRVPEHQTEEKEETFSSTLRRSMSIKRRTIAEVLQQDILEREKQEEKQLSGHETNEFAFEPLNIPEPTEKQLEEIKSYRMSEKKYANLVSTLALFNGTHNFHNYIPGSVQDDSRCFVNIYNIDASPLEVHQGMEWIRIKIQANAFARDQVRKMMAMLILVIRTNTPRSALGNSFGFSKIDIPETPEGFQIFDEPHYNNYNAEAYLSQSPKPMVRFGDVDGQVQSFRRAIHQSIYAKESMEMRYESWLHQIDNYSFMYCHFLNARGVFTKPRYFPKESSMQPVSENQGVGIAGSNMLESKEE